jgi:hypothetical protein
MSVAPCRDGRLQSDVSQVSRANHRVSGSYSIAYANRRSLVLLMGRQRRRLLPRRLQCRRADSRALAHRGRAVSSRVQGRARAETHPRCSSPAARRFGHGRRHRNSGAAARAGDYLQPPHRPRRVKEMFKHMHKTIHVRDRRPPLQNPWSRRTLRGALRRPGVHSSISDCVASCFGRLAELKDQKPSKTPSFNCFSPVSGWSRRLPRARSRQAFVLVHVGPAVLTRAAPRRGGMQLLSVRIGKRVRTIQCAPGASDFRGAGMPHPARVRSSSLRTSKAAGYPTAK